MSRPWFRRQPSAGEILLVEQVKGTERVRLHTYRPPAPVWPVVAVSLTGLAVVAIIAAVARLFGG